MTLRAPWLPHLQRVLKLIVAWVLWLVALIGSGEAEQHFISESALLGLLFALPFTCVLLGGLWLLVELEARWRKQAADSIQVLRDRRAFGIYEEILAEARGAERTPPQTIRYCLYLRPFRSTSHVKVVERFWTQRRRLLDPDPIGSVMIEGQGWSTVYRRYAVWGDLETLVARAIERSGTYLLALGRPGEQIGAGRIESTDQTWQADVSVLAERALALLVLPSCTEGTRWELEFVLADGALLNRTWFLIPPKEDLVGVPASMSGWSVPGASRARTAAVAWLEPNVDLGPQLDLHTDAIRALERCGIRLPTFSNAGAILRVGRDRMCVWSTELVSYRKTISLNPSRFDAMRCRLHGIDSTAFQAALHRATSASGSSTSSSRQSLP